MHLLDNYRITSKTFYVVGLHDLIAKKLIYF